MTISVKLPAPGQNMGANGGGANRNGRFAAQRAAKGYKAECEWEALLQKRNLPAEVLAALPLTHAHVRIIWFKGPMGDGCYRPRDEDNARTALKPALDSLVTQGLLKDDARKFITTEFHFSTTSCKPRSAVREPAVVVFDITEREPEIK